MGTTNYIAYGRGMTETEALRNAVEQDRQENGYQDGYSGTIGSRISMNSKCVKQPKPAKKCTVVKTQNKPKFKKVIAVRPMRESSHWNSSENDTSSKTKGEAIKKAKAMALKHGKPFIVRIEMEPLGSTELATISPKESEMGEWKFWGDAKD